MKISKVTIRNFKRFKEETFNLDGNVVIAGPNNCGKTTLLQAIATWSMALERWRELNDYQRHGGAYTRAPIARQAFYAVPLRAFDLLWNERSAGNKIEITLTFDSATVPMEIESDSTEQVYVRPAKNVAPEWLRDLKHFPKPIFVPAMTGLSTEEPVYQQPKINQLLGQGKPGDVLRNLLVETNQNQDSWERLTDSIYKTFSYQLLPPNADGPNIVAEYQEDRNNARFDIASAGSGFLQVLILMTFLNSRQGVVLLLDEPDAHLHVILQDSIYEELRSTAQTNGSQLIVATHSEVVINAVDPRELCALLGKPKKVVDSAEKSSLIRSLSVLSNMDIMLAQGKGNILYVEGHTDLGILRSWADILGHRAKEFMNKPFWKPTVLEKRLQGKGIKAQEHFKSLLLVEQDTRGVQISDRDGNKNIPNSKMAQGGRLLKLCWARYEIENYLVHPAVLARFIDQSVGAGAPLADLTAMKEEMRRHLPGTVVDDPLNDGDILLSTKMRDSILPRILANAGLQNFSYTRYMEIAAVMQPDEIHPEITEKLDAIANHFDL